MNTNEHLMLKLMEECAEVQQRVSKLLQFGRDEKEPGQELTNQQRLDLELNDLMVVQFLLLDKGLIGDISGAEFREYNTVKRAKIAKYLAYSQELGMVDR